MGEMHHESLSGNFVMILNELLCIPINGNVKLHQSWDEFFCVLTSPYMMHSHDMTSKRNPHEKRLSIRTISFRNGSPSDCSNTTAAKLFVRGWM